MAYFRKVPAKNSKGYSWAFTINLPNDPVTGKRRQATRRGFETKKAAEKAATKLLNELHQGIYYDSKNMNVAQFMDIWIKTKRNIAETTYAQYQSKINKWIKPYLGQIKLDKLTASHGESFITVLLDNMGEATAHKVVSIVDSALDHAVKTELIPKNPFKYIEKPKEEISTVNTLTFPQLKTFLDNCRDHVDYNLYYVAANTGLRKGELLGLRKSDVDLEKGIIRIRQSVYEVKGKVTIGPPKTKNSKRDFSVNKNVCHCLKKQISKNNQYKLLMGERYQDNDLIFCKEDGGIRRPSGVNRPFSNALKSAGIPHIRFHDLRHTHATLLLELGVNPKIVSERLGHKSIKVTLDIYSHVSFEMQEKISDLFTNTLEEIVAE